MSSYDYSTDLFLNRLYEDTKSQRAEQETACSDARRQQLKEEVRQALGKFPDSDAPLQPILLETKDYGDFIMERLSYSTMDSVHVPVIVLIPKQGQGPWPAVLACHGHGGGQGDAVGVDTEGNPLAEPGIHNRFAVELAKRGLLVVIPEIMGFGVRQIAEERRNNPNHNSCATLSAHLLMYGRTLAGMRVYEAMRALDYLQSRADVNSDRIGIFGFSGGGLIAALTTALDERIQAAVLTGWTNTFQGSILAMHHCIDNYLPGILLVSEQPEIIGLAAPRSLFVESGEQDPIFPVEHVRTAIEKLRSIYASMGAEDRFEEDFFPSNHRISGRKSFDWLASRLQD